MVWSRFRESILRKGVSTPSGLFSLRLMFGRSKLESLRDVRVTKISDTFPMVFTRLYKGPFKTKQ